MIVKFDTDNDMIYIIISGRAVATPYLGMALVFMGFGHFQVSETAIKQPQNLKLMCEMRSTGQADPTPSIRCLQMCPRAQGRISEKPHICTIHTPNNSLFPGIETFDILFLF